MKLVTALNAVHLNVWAILIMVGGIVLMCCKHPAEGATLTAISAALLRSVDPTTKKEETVAA